MIDIADRLAVLELYGRQAQLIDDGDALGWAETFAPDGVFVSPTFALTARGHGALREFAAASYAAARARGEQLRHWTGQHVLSEADAGQLTVRGYMLIVATSAQGPRIDRSLRFVDEVQIRGGRWLMTSRTMIRDEVAVVEHA
jgi:hypothetical protein